LLTILP
jgi:hypothetical protein